VAETTNEASRMITTQPLLAKRFELVKVLGSGGAAAVFHVKDTERGGEEVALKVLTNSGAFDALTLSRFEAEVALLQEINHPHIVRAYDFISLGHTVAYTMELVRGKELSRYLKAGSLGYGSIDSIFRQLLSALHELHSRGVFHRDLKLENLLYCEESGIKLADFGLMKIKRTSRDTQAGVLLGTAQYLPPEYIRSNRYDARSDLYCVGLLLFEMVSGTRWLSKFSGNDSINYLVERNFVVPYELPLTVPRKYHRIIDKAIKPDAKRRYQSAYDMLVAFAEDETDNRRGDGLRNGLGGFQGRSARYYLRDPIILFFLVMLILVSVAISLL
jgi:serine/threonine protein kinase